MTTPGGWGPQPGPYGPAPQQPPSPYGQPQQPSPYAQPAQPQGSPYAQPPSPYGQPQEPVGKSRARLWAGVGAATLVVVVVAALVVVFGGRGDQSAQNAQQSVQAEAKDRRKTGGPFLDPIPTLPVSLWTDQAGDIAGSREASIRFLSANENTVLTLLLDDTTYALVALDAATGKKKWQTPVSFDASVTSCGIAGDSSVFCVVDLSGSPLPDGLSPDQFPKGVVQVVFFSPDGAPGKTVTLDSRQAFHYWPLSDGLLLAQNAVGDDTRAVTRFSNSGDQRWTVTGQPGQKSFDYSATTSLFLLSGPFAATVYSLDTGQQIADSSAIGDASGPGAKQMSTVLNRSGFAIAASNQVHVFNAQGKQTNLIAGWSLPDILMHPSSSECGQIMLGNTTGAIAAADAATGQILWQTQAGGESSTNKMACVGDYLLLRSTGSQTVGVFELDTGKKTGSFTVDSASWSVVGTDGSILLAVSFDGGSATYFAYDLATGKQVWTSPRSENGQYKFCVMGGAPSVTDPFVGGGLYYVVAFKGGSITRLGHKG